MPFGLGVRRVLNLPDAHYVSSTYSTFSSSLLQPSFSFLADCPFHVQPRPPYRSSFPLDTSKPHPTCTPILYAPYRQFFFLPLSNPCLGVCPLNESPPRRCTSSVALGLLRLKARSSPGYRTNKFMQMLLGSAAVAIRTSSCISVLV